MSLSAKIIDEIYTRITRKHADNLHVKSITLGVDLYNHVVNNSQNVFYSYFHKATIFGYPVTISYKRKNLIQINVKRLKSHRSFLRRFVKDFTSEYKYGFVGYGDGGKSMFSDMIYNFYQNSDKEDCMKINLKYLKYRDLEHSGKNYLTSSPKSI